MANNEAKFVIQAIGIGDAMVDLYTHSAVLPPRGGNIWCPAAAMAPGGTTANVAANLAVLGIASAFAGGVGEDPYGRYVCDEFERVGVDTRWVVAKPGAYTGIVLAIIDGGGERTFIACAQGAAHTRLVLEDVRAIDFRPEQIVHSSGVCLVEAPPRAALFAGLERARASGAKVYFDPNLRLEGSFFPDDLRVAIWKAIGLSDVVLVGEEELAILCEDCTPQEGAARLRSQGPELIVVKNGERGASAYWEGGEEHRPAFRVDVVSTAGAGDSFDAGFIAARLRGNNTGDCLEYANAVAALKVTRQGARAVPTHGEVQEFLRK